MLVVVTSCYYQRQRTPYERDVDVLLTVKTGGGEGVAAYYG